MSGIDFKDKEIDEFYNNITQNIKRIRKEKGITQLELAYSMGYKNVSSIGKIESGQEGKHYNLKHIYKIAKILDTDVCEFFK